MVCKFYEGNAARIPSPVKWPVSGGLLHRGSTQKRQVSSRQAASPRRCAPSAHSGRLPPGVEQCCSVNLLPWGECSRPVLSKTAAISHVSPLSALKVAGERESFHFVLLPLVAGSTGLAPPWPGGAVQVLWERPWALLPLLEAPGLTSPAEG